MPQGAHGIVWTCHPNNPTGRAWDRGRLLDLIDRTPAGLTVVDEAYLPFLPDEAERTVVPSVVDRDNLIVMRSMKTALSACKPTAFRTCRLRERRHEPDQV